MDQHQDGIIRRTLFYLNDTFDAARIHRVRAQPVKTSGGKYNHPAPLNNPRRFFYQFGVRVLGINSIYFWVLHGWFQVSGVSI
jgi:hypothetical protein